MWNNVISPVLFSPRIYKVSDTRRNIRQHATPTFLQKYERSQHRLVSTSSFSSGQTWKLNCLKTPALQEKHINISKMSSPSVTVCTSGIKADTPVTEKCRWNWKGYSINYTKTGSGPAVLLVHGFAASLGHYRQNIPVLSEKYTVYAVDLLGFGESSKPVGYQHSLDSWRDLVLDFQMEVIGRPMAVVGNSIGSLIALMAAQKAKEGDVQGVVLLNCAGGMNSKFILNEGGGYRLFLPLFWLIDFIFKTEWIIQALFERLAKRENIQTTLKNIYIKPENVDEELVEMFYRPSEDEGAIETFVSVLTGAPGARPQDVTPDVKCPIEVIWGSSDSITMIDGPIGTYYAGLALEDNSNVQMHVVDAGHCPQDDDVEVVNDLMMKFFSRSLSV